MPVKITAKEWDEVRSAFAASIMVNTALGSLAQNLDGPEWPIKAKDETPAKYIDLTFDEMTELLALKGLAPEKADLLTGILRDTLSFDNPFGDMVAQTAAAEKKDNPLLKNLARLDIPAAFPISLACLSADTIEFCRLEKLATLGDFAIFAQNMSQNVIVGGDFRKLLNALSHIDERTIAECLPFRPGAKGLHLVESVAQATTSPRAAERTAEAIGWFRTEFDVIRQDVATGGALVRHTMVLGKPDLEAKVAGLLKPHLGNGAERADTQKTGFFRRLFKK